MMIKGYCGSLYGNYRQNKFTDVYNNVNTFLADYSNIGIPPIIKSESVKTLFYLLYGRYGNSTIANSDINQFKYRLFSLIFQHGPTWEKKLELQSKVRALSDEDLTTGGVAIYNSASNPSTEPTTETLDELQFINNQNVTRYKKTKIEGYALQWDMLSNDLTETFLGKFQQLFLQFVEPELPLWYTEGVDDEP